MDAISETQHSLLEYFTPEPGDRVFAALLLHPMWQQIGGEPVAPAPTTTLSTPVATPSTFLARLGERPNWQLALVALGLGIGLGWGIGIVFGGKAAVAAATVAAL